MEKLPEALVLEILSRLDDSADVARCRRASKTFDTVSTGLRSINLQWKLQSYLQSRSRVSSSSQFTSPLKRIILNLISNLSVVESVRIGAENPRLDVSNTDVEHNGDDLYLTDGGFVKDWLPRVFGDLKSLSLSDFWVQSFWRRSEVLSLVSLYCYNLVELEVKNTWLSVENMNPMPILTTLTLEFIRLDDEDLKVLSKSFPNLQVLNLIHIKGLEQPMIHFPNLKTCHWTLADYWSSSITLITPKLITLRVEGIMLDALHVEAPLLSHFHLALDELNTFPHKGFESLKTVWIEYASIHLLLKDFPLTRTVETVTLDSRDSASRAMWHSKFTLEELVRCFRNTTCLCFKERAWLDFWVGYGTWDDGTQVLKTFRGYLEPSLTDFSSVACVLERCVNLEDVSLLIHHVNPPRVYKRFITKCMEAWPKVKWRWGMWGKGMEDSWIPDDQLPEEESSDSISKATMKLKRYVQG